LAVSIFQSLNYILESPAVDIILPNKHCHLDYYFYLKNIYNSKISMTSFLLEKYEKIIKVQLDMTQERDNECKKIKKRT